MTAQIEAYRERVGASLDRTQHRLDEVAMLSFYAAPRPGRDVRPAANLFTTRATLHRFETAADPVLPSPPLRLEHEIEQAIRSVVHGRHPRITPRFHVIQTVAEAVGSFHCECRLFDGEHGFDMSKSGRFQVSGATFDFGGGDRARGEGIGRGYPAEGGRLLFAGAGELKHASGKLAGLPATFSMNGSLDPSAGFTGSVTCRFQDPSALVRTDREIPEPRGMPWQAESTFLELRLEKDSSRQTGFAGAGLTMRSARFVCESQGYRGLRSRLILGPCLGTVEATLDATKPPGLTARYEYRFLDTAGHCAGTLCARIDDAVGTSAANALRFAAFGPIESGSGLFEGVHGLVAEDSAVSFDPEAFSLMQTLQIVDREGRHRTGE